MANKPEKLTLTTTFAVPPARVWRAWLSSKEHAAMTGGGLARQSPTVGSKHSAWDGYISGRITALAPGKSIRMTWRTTDFDDAAPDSLVEVRLAKAATGCKLTVVHTQLPTGSAASYRQGWRDYYFEPMRAYFSTAE